MDRNSVIDECIDRVIRKLEQLKGKGNVDPWYLQDVMRDVLNHIKDPTPATSFSDSVPATLQTDPVKPVGPITYTEVKGASFLGDFKFEDIAASRGWKS